MTNCQFLQTDYFLFLLVRLFFSLITLFYFFRMSMNQLVPVFSSKQLNLTPPDTIILWVHFKPVSSEELKDCFNRRPHPVPESNLFAKWQTKGPQCRIYAAEKLKKPFFHNGRTFESILYLIYSEVSLFPFVNVIQQPSCHIFFLFSAPGNCTLFPASFRSPLHTSWKIP